MTGRVTLLCVVVLGVLGLSASAASAQTVHVENPGTHQMESEVDFGINFHNSMGGTIPLVRCDNDWELEVQEDGHFVIVVHDIAPHAGGTVGQCSTIEACDAEPWEGQVVEDGDGGFEAQFDLCISGTGTPLSGVVIPTTCQVVNAEFHCDSAMPITGGSLEVEGEVSLSDSLGLMHLPDVHVENPGAHALSSEVDLGVMAHIGGGVEVPAIQCDAEWQLTASEEGDLEIDASGTASHSGSTGLCDTLHPCDDEPWAGEISEDGAGGFEAEFDFCLDETSAGIDGNVYELACPIANGELHCDQTIVAGAGTLLSPRIEVQGEATLATSLGLMHAD
jgi:hypothetical protein